MSDKQGSKQSWDILDAKDSNGNTALHVAAGNFNKQKFKSFKLFSTIQVGCYSPILFGSLLILPILTNLFFNQLIIFIKF